MPRNSNRISNRKFWDSAISNSLGYQQYYSRLTELAVSMFEWKNIPKTIDPRYLELVLFTDGQAVIFKDDVLGLIAMRVKAIGNPDIYGVPTQRVAYANNGYQMDLNPENSIIVYNNFLRTNSMLDVERYSQKLYDLDETITVNAKAQKTPILILCDENERLTMENIYMKYSGNMPVIMGQKGLNPKAFTVLQTGAPYVADKLYQLKTQVWNEALTTLGISNINVSKKERLITDEVIRNQGGVMANRYSRTVMRQNACKAINDMFGTNISCEYRADSDIEEMNEIEAFSSDEKGGDMRE